MEIYFIEDEIDTNNQGYYEVELWGSGDCDSHYFLTKREATRYFNEHKKHPSDCVKYHEPIKFGGDYYIIEENKQ